MKNNALLFSILLLFFGAPFCMAKSTVLTTPLVFAPSGGADFVICTFVNSGAADVDLTISALGMDGTVLNTDTLVVAAHTGFTLPATSTAVSNYYYCTFSIQGKTKAARGMIQVSTLGRVYATAPAN